jgi:hypothetical protein
MWLWRAFDLGPIVTFATGILVGLLIPSENWVAIGIVILVGALHQGIIRTGEFDRGRPSLRGIIGEARPDPVGHRD